MNASIDALSRDRKRELLLLKLRQAAVARTPTAANAAIPAADRGAPLPLSFAQQRLWFVDQFDHAAGAAYHMPAALRLRGHLDRAALQATLDRVLARHESLRTRFASVDGVPRQVIAPADIGLALQVSDLGGLAEPARSEALAAAARDALEQPFDLATGPLIRGALLRLADDDHVLLLTQHHIVSDGWSIGVLIGEVSALYGAFCRGEADPLPPLPLQYADYAAWQRDWLQGDAQAAQTTFWKDYLGGAPALLPWPTARPRPPVRSHAGGSAAVTIPHALADRLRALGQRHGTTLFMTLLAGWSVLLSRLAGQDDVVIGTPVANRPRRELEGLIGFFANTLALRLPLAPSLTVAEALATARHATLSAFDHQQLPFDQVVEALQPQRSLAHSPLFQVMFSMTNTPGANTLDLPGLQLEAIEQPQTSAQFDLSLSCTDTGGEIVGGLQYASDLFDRTSVERLGDRLLHVLAAMAEDDGRAIAALPLLDAAERDGLARRFAAPTAEFPADATLPALFRQQVARTPDAIAVEGPGGSLTYAALNARANRLAHRLRAEGVGPERLVGLCAERGVDMLVGLLAVLKAGGAYVPLDPAYPAQRLAFQLDDAAPLLVLVDDAGRALLADAATPLLAIAGDDGHAAQPDTDPDVPGASARDLAYVIYTSGSTGDPKGVMVEHRSLVNLWSTLTRDVYAPLSANARIGLNAGLSFDASLQAVTQLLSGRCVVVMPQDVRRDSAAFAAFVQAQALEAFDCTPAQLAQVFAVVPDWRPAALRTVVIGGEAIASPLWTRLAAWDGIACWNVYGPTECTVDATGTRIEGPAPHIGRPLANVPVHVLDAGGQPVPVGVIGELHIGGVQVARGYWRRDALTAERFIADPQATAGGDRLYRTGDLARWRADGSLDYLGRNDHQVKIRGFRIELGEIEAQLGRLPGVGEAAVLVRADAGEARLVAYVVATSAALDAAGLRAQLATRLPEAMVPAAFVLLDRLPMTANGKLDRAALPAPGDEAVARREFVAPRDATERAVATVWQQLLGLAQVGRHDHFFDLGGHSLLAVRVVSQLREALGAEVALPQLFAHPVLADFAAVVAGAGRTDLAPIVPADRSGPLPLSYAQQRMWFVNRLDGAAGLAYHLPLALRIDGVLDVDALQATLDRIVARHESLRTTFVDVDGTPCQRIARADIGFALLRQDLSGLADDRQAAALQRSMDDETAQPFDLATGPLIRGRLLRLGDAAHVLLITQHHIITDGWSIGLLMQEVSTLYRAFAAGTSDPLPALQIQYADYAAWQRGRLQGEALQAQADFWKHYLHGVPTLLNLPADRPRPAKRDYAGASLGATLSPALTAKLRALSQRHGTTLFMTMLAGWSIQLARISGQHDLVIGSPVANRQRSDLEPLIGFFVNTLALRVRLDGDPSLADLLTTIRRDTLQAFEHQDLPFEQVVEIVQPVRSMSHSPLFQVILNWETAQDDTRLSLPGLEMHALDQGHSTTPYDLTLFLKDVGDRILCSWRYTTDLFDADSIERMTRQFECLLEDMVANETTPVSRLRLLDDTQRRQVLETFNATATDDHRDALVHGEFERQVALRPEAVAVVAEDGELTFAQLNRRANQVAHALIARGVRPDDIVGLCVERSVDMLVGLFGILKAGGAYLPLDPALPPERLAHMLHDSGAVAALVQPRTRDALPATGLPFLSLDAGSADLRGQPDTNPDPGVLGLHPRHLAYVIYTSGSTGAAKGVMVEHRSPVNFWRAMERSTHAHCSPHGRVALNASFSFDMSLKGILQLLSGRCVVLIPSLIRADGAAMLRFLAAHAIEAFDCTPSQLSVLLAAGLLESTAYRPVSVLIGGEPIDPAMWRRLRSASGIRFYNMYGPTECTVDATIGAVAELGEQPSIGWPVDNLRVLILDPHGEPAPIGVAGELHLGGAGVARGYLHRPELTAERFVRDRFHADPAARVYRSGDLGRWRADGSIEYLGRNDFQVKIRGYRIELGEIEAALQDCPGIRDAAVIAREDTPGDRRLVAYVVSDESTLDVAGLRARLATRLADYMLPAAFVALPQLPLNNNGKLDRHALPAPDAAAVASSTFAAPQGEWENAVAEIWRELLDLERVGRDDNFFDIGGHSLLGVLLLSRLHQDHGVEVPLRVLFVYPTLREFAAATGFEAAPPAFRNLVAVRAGGDETPLFLLHPSEGEIGYARTLAAALDPALPVYGLAATGLGEGEVALTSIEDMATQYLREIRQVQPQGPYRLAGWSAGGTLAYEIAHQLIGADQTVEFLGLIDTAGDYRVLHELRSGNAPPAAEGRDFDAWICSLEWLPPEHDAALRPALEALARNGQVEALLAHAQHLGELPADLDPALLRRHLALRHAMGEALLAYVRPPLPIAFTLFSALDEDRRQRPVGWTPDVRHRRIDVPGNHFSLVQAPHVQVLADALAGELRRSRGQAPALAETTYAPLVTIQSGRAGRQPLFCVPGAGASVAAFAALAQAMDPAIPIHGLQPRGLCGQLVPHVDVPSTARAYLQSIRTLAPRGPYRLLGHSYGGWVAAEMARQLEADGERVDALVVLDSMPPPSPDQPYRRLSRRDVLARLIEIYELTLQRPLGVSASDLAALVPHEQLAALLSRLIDARVMHRSAGIETMRGIVQVFATNINTCYQPPAPYAGTLHLVKVAGAEGVSAAPPADAVAALGDHACGWRHFAADTRCWTAPGNHMTLLGAPHVGQLAGWLQPLLGGAK